MSFNPRKALEVAKRGLAEKPSGSMVIFILAILGSNTEDGTMRIQTGVTFANTYSIKIYFFRNYF